MWEYILMLIFVAIILISSTSNYNQSGGNGDSTVYYQQHSRFPIGAWWIPFSDPRERCHAIARNRCHNKYYYDNCYENILNNCNPMGPPNPDLLPY